MIQYRIQPSRPEAHVFTVTLTIPAPTPEGQVLRMPAWIPGSYMIRDFARHVLSLRAESAGAPVAVAKLDKDSWQAAPCDGPLQVTIDVYGWDLSVRGAHLDTRHAYFNGTCVFLQPIGHEDQPCEVEMLAPEGAAYATWRVATGMPRVTGGEWDFGRFRAENYDDLIDYPVGMGHFEDARFEAGGIVHRVIISGHRGADLDRLVRDLQPICEQHIALFEEKPPMQDYLFMTLVTPDGYGGLEHRNSTSLMCARTDLPRRSDAPDKQRDSYRTYLGLCSHEYFHSWMVKRIKPAAFTPYDLSQENYTELLWAFEGITSYYDDLGLARCGKISTENYLELLGTAISRVARGRGEQKQTVTESSFDAWTRFYKQDENASNAIVSYYAKGSLVALALDFTLRRITNGAKSLDDLMRLLWQRYGKIGVGVPEQGIQLLAEELAGQSLQEFFDLALYSTEPLPIAELLADAGVELHWRVPLSHADQGGKPGNGTVPLNLGVRVAEDASGARIQVAFEQGAAMAAGLSAGDVIIALNGMKTDARKLDDQLQQFLPGDEIEVHAFRRDELIRVKVRLDAGEASLAYLTVAAGGLTEVGRSWLNLGNL